MDAQQQLHQSGRTSGSLQGHARPCLTSPHQRSTCTAVEEAEKKAELQRRIWFENGMKRTFRIPSGYVTIAVLVIRWHDAVDDYKEGHDSEVAELKQLFECDFGYKYEEVRLRTSTAKKPQHDLNAAIANHVQKYDSPNSLLIIYYTGHGVLRGSGNNRVLELSASSKSLVNQDGTYTATAYWYQAERHLSDSAEADVLTIFDCCYASNAIKGWAEEHRVYEMIAASPKDFPTPAPGANSFTRRLIDSLRELLEEHQGGCFPTDKVVDRINKKNETPHRGPKLPAVLHDCLQKFSGRHIELARVDNKVAERKQELLDQQPVEMAHLDLRFSLQKPDLEQDEIEALAPKLQAAFQKANIHLCRIDWDRFVQNRTHTLHDNVRASVFARRWRKITLRSSLNSPVSGVLVPPALEHTTSRDIVESPVALSDEPERQPLLGSDSSFCKDKPVAAVRGCHRLLRYLRCKGAVILARIRRVFRKGSAFRSMA